MTVINLHGILAEEFGKTFQMNIRKPKEVMDAISANRTNFRNRVLELSNQGIHYSVIVDGKNMKNGEFQESPVAPKKIDIVPVLCGSGPALIPLVMAAASFGASATGATVLGITAAQFGMMGVTFLGMAAQMLLAPKPKAQQIKSEISGAKESFLMSSKANVSTQGTPVPVGYGRLRVGSSVIHATIKSYPMTESLGSSLIGGNYDPSTAIVTRTLN